MAKEYGDKQFNRDFNKLTDIITKRLMAAKTTAEIQNELDMLQGMAMHENSPAPAKTIYGLAYLMEDKPWYDFERGMTAVKEAADTAAENEPFCWFMLGSLYLNGKGKMQKDPIQAKYWIEKAADAGYPQAQYIREVEWGDNPAGFKDWYVRKLYKEEQVRKALRIAIPLILIISLGIAYLLTHK